MDETKRVEAANFLKEIKSLITLRDLYLVPREKNHEALIALGITRKICEEEILSLTPDNYYSGPDPDRDKPGDIWVFHTTLNQQEIYIKLKIVDAGRERFAKCLSFHPAEYQFK